MKKKILALICILSMLAAMAPAMGAVAASEKAVMFEKDFLVNGSPLADDGDATDTGKRTSTFASGMKVNEHNGYAYAEQIDSERGNSLKIGIKETAGTADPVLDIPITDFHKNEESGSLVLEFDYYINEKTNFKTDFSSSSNYQKQTFYISTYGVSQGMAYWDQNLVDGFSNSNTISYNAGEWNRCRLEFSWTLYNNQANKYRYSYVLRNGTYENGVFSGYGTTSFQHTFGTSKIGKTTALRLYLPREVNGEKWIALDNVTIKQEKDDPRITGIEGGSVAYDAKTVSINLSDKIYNRDKNYVALYEGETECELSTVSFDSSNNRITIKPAEGFKPMTTYKVVLKTTTEVDIVGTTLSKAEEMSFTTTEAPIVNPAVNENFENATISGSDTTLDSGVVVSKGSGYALTKNIDGHGNVLKLGIGQSGTQLPRVDIPLSGVQTTGQSGNAKIEFDFLIGVKPLYDAENPDATVGEAGWYSEGAFRLGPDDSTTKKFLYWHNKIKDNYNSNLEQQKDYETEKWYRAVLELSWVPSGSQFNYTYSVQLTDGASYNESYSRTINDTSFATISFFAPKTVNEDTWAYLDNIKLSTQKPIPDIRRVEAFDALDKFEEFDATDTPEDAFVNVDKKSLVAVYLTETITGADETLVSLKENGIDVEIEKVGYDGSKNAVLLLLAEPLKDNTAYTFTLSENTEVWTGVPMGVNREKAFTTSSDTVSIDVDSDDITISGGSATVNVAATNMSDTPIKVYLIANVWDGNKFIGQSVTVQEVAETTSLSATVSGVEAGYTVYVSVWNNVFGAEMLTNKIVSKTNN